MIRIGGPTAQCPDHGWYSLHTGCFWCDYEMCNIPPSGWICTRVAGHDGPCAAHPVSALNAGQTRADSWTEVAVNIAIGATVSLASQVIIFPAYGIHVGTSTHLGIVGAFTVVSVARQYVIRRLCNGRSPWMAMKRRVMGNEPPRDLES